MNSFIIKGTICLEDDYHFQYKIARIEYEEYEDESYVYRFYPHYSVIDLLSNDLFQGIPGLDLSLRKEVYIRSNMVPVFISERAPQNNREDLWQLLEECNMSVNNNLEWLIRTNTRYSGDRLYVISYEKTIIYQLNSMYELVDRSNSIIKKLLQIISSGDCLITKEVEINDSSRMLLYNLLMPIYSSNVKVLKAKQQEGIKNAQVSHHYKGRQKKEIDNFLFNQLKKDYISHNITAENASKRLGVSRSTFIRRINSTKE